MSRQARTPAQVPSTAATRQNEYFVPRDGIDREVISADICRYLGNDALVRPGTYENPQSGQVVQGYYITAYRNLTTAMIEDLKADSARWESERRAQTTRNTSGVQYRYSETHQSRQHHGPTEGHFQQEPYSRESGYEARYPGTGAPGFTGASGPYASQQQQQQQQQPPPPLPPPQSYASSGGGAYGGSFQQPQQPPPQDRLPPFQAGVMMRPGYQSAQDAPYIGTGANLPHSGYSSQNDLYGARLPTSAAAQQQSTYASTQPQQPGYQPGAPSFQQYPSQSPAPPAGQSYQAMQQPHEAYYHGRASPAQPQQQGYPAQGQQYDVPPVSRRPSTTPAMIQTPSARSSNPSDRDGDRHHRAPRR